MTEESDRYRAAIDRFDSANRDDPCVELDGDSPSAKELLYSQRMTQMLNRFAPDAPETVRLATRAQHICRWKIPRDHYPAGRDGYRRWRSDLGRFHAEISGQILREVGYDQISIARVQSLLRKERRKSDPDCQLLEDVACLVFVQHYLADFADKHDEAKVINIVRRTWNKMSPYGWAVASELDLSPTVDSLLEKAIGADK
jgi:hypothetical protein